MIRNRILISQKNLSGMNSGVHRKVHEEIKYFSSCGCEVYVVAERINDKSVRESGGVPYKTFRWPFRGYYRRLSYLKQTDKAIKSLNPCLVIGHGDIVEQDICYIHNCVHLASEMVYGKPLPARNDVGRIHKKILEEQKFKILVCNSNLMRDDLVARFKIPKEKVVVVYPEYDASKFFPDNTHAREKTRQKLGVNEDDVLLGFITSGAFRKRNLDVLIDAVAKLQMHGVGAFKVLVAGKDKVAEYKDKIKALGLEDLFVFSPPVVDVERYYNAIDAFVLPAFLEEFGRSVLEAMACAKPVVISNMVGCSEILENESRDFVLNELTADELFTKLKAIILNDEIRIRLGKINYDVARNHSNVERNKEFTAVLRKINFLGCMR